MPARPPGPNGALPAPAQPRPETPAAATPPAAPTDGDGARGPSEMTHQSVRVLRAHKPHARMPDPLVDTNATAQPASPAVHFDQDNPY